MIAFWPVLIPPAKEATMFTMRNVAVEDVEGGVMEGGRGLHAQEECWTVKQKACKLVQLLSPQPFSPFS